MNINRDPFMNDLSEHILNQDPTKLSFPFLMQCGPVKHFQFSVFYLSDSFNSAENLLLDQVKMIDLCRMILNGRVSLDGEALKLL